MPNPSVVTDDIPPEKLWNAHDRLFRRVFSDPAHACGVLRRIIPAGQAVGLDWSSLRLVPSSYVDETLGPTASDLLFEVTSRSTGPMLVYLLWEHQSTQDPLMPLRLLGYAARCLADYVRSQPGRSGPIPRLVPLVLYQGKQPWTAPRRLSELCQPTEDTRELVELELLVHELRNEDAEILARATALTALARAALVAMKLVAARADLAAHAALIGRLLGEVRRADGAAGLRPLLEYLLRTRGSERELRAIMNATEPGTGVIVQSVYEQLIARGRVEGEARGRAEGEARGRAEGEARGRAEGEARGKAKGEAHGKADMLVQLCQARFGAVPLEVIDRIREAAVPQLDRWARRLLAASSLDELFDD